MVGIEIDTSDVRALLRGWERQFPFAFARALSLAAKQASKDVGDNLGDHFTLRNQYVRRGMGYKPASKRNLTAWVTNSRSFMAPHVTGGERAGGGGSQPVGVRAPKTRTLTRRWWPSQMMRRGKRKAFLAPIRHGSSRIVLYRRKTRKRLPLQLLYVFNPSVTLKSDWPFRDEVLASLRASWSGFVRKAVTEAIQTAKRRG